MLEQLILPCEPPPFGTVEIYPLTGTGPESGFVGARQYAPRTRRHSVTYRGVPIQFWTDVVEQFRRSAGGALRLEYTPPRGGPARPVRLVGPIRRTGESPGTVTFSFEIVEAL